jgi:hypothetical protein
MLRNGLYTHHYRDGLDLRNRIRSIPVHHRFTGASRR